jgi:heat shock protein HslJ
MNKKAWIALIVLIVIIGGIIIVGAMMRGTNDQPAVEQQVPILNGTVAQPAPAAPETQKNPILGTQWVWIKTTFLSGPATTAPAGKFMLKFNDDLTLSSTTDCNGISGKFIVDDEVLSVGPLASTLMACTSPTLEGEYSKELSRTTSYVIVGNELHINLARDTGTMIFTKR